MIGLLSSRFARVTGMLWFIGASMLVVVPGAIGQTVIDWTAGGVNDAYDDGHNWAGGNVPDNTFESAQFNLAGTYKVTLVGGSSTTVSDLIVRTGNITFGADATSIATYEVDDDLILVGGDLTLSDVIGAGDVQMNVGDELQVYNGSMLSVDGGSVVNTLDLRLADVLGGDGTIVVDGVRSELNKTGIVVVNIGRTGVGTLTYQNRAVGNIASTLQLANLAGPGDSGNLNVLSDAQVTVGTLQVAASGTNATASGNVAVDGGSSLEVTANLTIGNNTAGGTPGNVSVSSSGRLTVGGTTTLNDTGTLTIADGTFNANDTITMAAGNTLTLDGGELNVDNGLDNTAEGTLEFFDGTLTVSGGVFAPNAGGMLDSYAINGATDTDRPHLVIDDTASTTIGLALLVGVTEHGELSITGGGSVVTNVQSNVGFMAGSVGVVNVDGTDSTWASPRIHLGGRVTAEGTLNITNGGTVTTIIGILGDEPGSNGFATVDGDGSSWTLSESLEVGKEGDGTLDITGGATVDSVSTLIASDDSNAEGNVTVDGEGSQLMSGELSVGAMGAGSLSILDRGSVSSGSSLNVIGDSADATGTVTVDGDGSIWESNSDELHVGSQGEGTLNIQNGGLVSSVDALIGESIGGNGTVDVSGTDQFGNPSRWALSGFLVVGDEGTGGLTISNGGEVVNDFGAIGGDASGEGTAIVTGEGSRWSNTHLIIGGELFGPRGPGSLTVADDGLVEIAGTLLIWSPGTVTLDGGNLVTETFDHTEGGTFNFIAGSLTINDGLTIGNDPAGVFPDSFTVNAEQALATATTTTVSAFRSLTLNGGSLTTNSLVVDGFFNFTSGTLELTGGSVTGLSELNVPTGGTLLASGIYDLPVSAAAGSAITATGNLTLGDNSNGSGFYTNGQVNVDDHTLSVEDANDAVFDSGASVDLGDAGTGTLAADNGLTLDFGGNISGFGAVNTPDDPVTPLINNGNITGNSLAEPVTLSGYVKGVGTCDNCNITGTDSPGFSAAAVSRGSVAYNGTLEIEIGGTTPGSEFDQLNHILDVGVANLGGVLDVSLINDFMPQTDDSFEIITAIGGVNGMFTTTADQLPALGGNLEWEILYGTNNVVLSVVQAGLLGDYNNNGTVDAADYTAWLAALGNGELLNDPTPGTVDQSDYAYWKAHFGETLAGSAASTAAVPEPATAYLLVVLVLLVGKLFAMHLS